MHSMDEQLSEQNEIKHKKSKANERMHSFKEKCISSCLLVLLAVGPMISFAKPAKAYANNEGQGAITTEMYNGDRGLDNVILFTPNGTLVQNDTNIYISWNPLNQNFPHLLKIMDITFNTVKYEWYDPKGSSLNYTGEIGHSYRIEMFRLDSNGKPLSSASSIVMITGSINNQPPLQPIYNPPQQQPAYNLSEYNTQQQSIYNQPMSQQSDASFEILAKPNVHYEINGNTVRLSWDRVPNAVRYEVVKDGRDSNNSWDYDDEKNIYSNDYIFNVTPGYTYIFSVIAFNTNDMSSFRDIKDIFVPYSQAQSIPQEPAYNLPTQQPQQSTYQPSTQPQMQTIVQPFPDSIKLNAIETVNVTTNNNNRTKIDTPSADRPLLPAPTIHMPDVDCTVFYLKDIDQITFSWDKINGARGYNIYQYDLTRDNGKLPAQYTASKDATSFSMPVLGGDAYRIEVVAIDNTGREGNKVVYTITEGRIVTRDLQLGCIDSVDVKVLHEKLNELGLDTGLNAGVYDGHFRDKTDTAVKAIQLYAGSKVDGIVDNDTWYSINTLTKEINSYNEYQKQELINRLNQSWNEINAEKTVLSYDMNREEVKVLQNKLNYLGLNTGGNQGVFGQETLYSVKGLQRACGITDDGVVGENTWASILDQIEIKKWIGYNEYMKRHGDYIQSCRVQVVREEMERRAAEEAVRQKAQQHTITTNVSELKITKDIDGNIYTKACLKDGRTLINFKRIDNVYNIDQTFDVDKLKADLNYLISEQNYKDDEYFNLWYNACQAQKQALIYVEGNNGRNCSFNRNDPEFYVLWYEILEYNTWKANTVQKFIDVGLAAFTVVDLGLTAYEYLAIRAEIAALSCGESITLSEASFRSIAEGMVKTWTSPDKYVGEIANAIEVKYPGKVLDVNKKIFRADGTPLTDYDIELDNVVIQIKSGGGKGATQQAISTASSTSKEVIIYLPEQNLGAAVVKELQRQGFKVFTSEQDLLNYLK